MTGKQDVVLLLTHRDDQYTIERVAAALSRRGAAPVRVDVDRFPLETTLHIETSGSCQRAFLHLPSGEIDCADVRAVWLRQLWEPDLGEEVEPAYRDACMKECRAAVHGLLGSLISAHWVNSLAGLRYAAEKCRQLRLAGDVGLTIPDTIVTNDPAHARRFYTAMGGKVVTKLLSPLSSSMERTANFLHTSEVTEADVEAFDSLRVSPMIFQRRIEKQRELRIVVVGKRLFVGALNASGTAGAMDWRLATPEECPWYVDELPAATTSRLLDLMDRLGLVYGAIDMIRTPTGEHVFLEVNPTGEWGMLERDLKFPISEALAGALLIREAQAT